MALFEILFAIDIAHDYYRDNLSMDFKIIPAMDTAQQLRNHGLLFRNTVSGFAILAEVIPAGGGDLTLLRSPDKPVRYRFLLQQRSNFLNYTDLPFHEAGKTIYYFNNLHTNIDEGTKYLQRSSAQVTAADQLPLKTGTFRYSVSDTGYEKRARLMFPDLSIEHEQKATNTEGTFNFQFDLSNHPAGRAELWIGGVKEETFYSAGRQETAGVFGIAEIFHSTDVPGAYQFINSSDLVTSQEYQLAFKKRRTFWKYIIVNKSGMDLDDPGIKDENSNRNYTFTQDSHDTHQPEEWTFISDQQIPLSKEGITDLGLYKNLDSSAQKVKGMDSLPNPGLNMLKRDEADISKFYSEVYLYI